MPIFGEEGVYEARVGGVWLYRNKELIGNFSFSVVNCLMLETQHNEQASPRQWMNLLPLKGQADKRASWGSSECMACTRTRAVSHIKISKHGFNAERNDLVPSFKIWYNSSRSTMSPKYLWVFSQNIWPPPKFLIRRPPLSYGNISTQTKKKNR